MAVQAAGPERPSIIIKPHKGLLGRGVRDVWAYRELAYFFVWRDVKVRYKQTVLGASWAVLQPFMLMVVFSIFLGHFANLPSNDLPYPVFAFAALVPWTMFASGITSAADSMVGNTGLVSKVYFPRLLLPIAAVTVPLVDFSIAMVVLAGMLVAYGVAPSIGLIAIPGFIVLAVLTAFGFGSLLATLNVRYRDFRYVTPFLMQFWLFATPVAYSATLVPAKYQMLYSLNPMTSVVEGFRWALLDTPAPSLTEVAISATVALVVTAAGLAYFQRSERTFADLI